MTLQECYEQLNGDYAGVLGRIMKEASVSRFLLMMIKDQEFGKLEQGLAEKDYELAFRAVHTLKGTSLNLGITQLAECASRLTEVLRNGAPTIDITEMVDELSAEYKRTMSILTEYSESIQA